ncbi:hypothetical protein KL928_000988 [Ogataea angusta]|uniref:Nudix hydrolase domain-containing protein n=1 Tax=Pichia angusta TaxID=870730 RepID=A0AAN6I724_PICAN|nr:uncharacterized protein KL928_000988 [Ogataea angusta]KAG7820904.1 hypothetical protein KL928_000988 [Ogataea angusta]
MDVVPYPHEEGYDTFQESVYVFYSHDHRFKLGYLLPLVVTELDRSGLVSVDKDNRSVQLSSELSTAELRSDKLNRLAREWKNAGLFSTLDGWRNELYTIYTPEKEPYMYLERALCPLLGVVMYGVHINGYVRTKEGLKLWIPRRSATKQTFPGMLDNTVAGGLGYPHGLMETCIKECYEEAGLTEHVVKQSVRNVGVMSFFYQSVKGDYTTEAGLLQPEVEYLYDLEMSGKTLPSPVDGEAEDFQLLDIPKICDLVKSGQFTPTCSGVIIDFLMRHGYLLPETEPDYIELASRLHRNLPFPLR